MMLLQQINLDCVLPVPSMFVVAAVFFTSDRRYLLQLRDDKPVIPLPNHWALFGGEVESGEDAQAAVIREIEEELCFKARDCIWYHEAVYVLPRDKHRVLRKSYYAIEIALSDVAGMVLSEGADMRLMTIEEITQLPRIAPWDLAVVLMHARENVIFQN